MTFHPSAFWPARPLSLLLIVALHPSDEAARAAWSEWERLGLVEDANWADLRVFPTVARRLAALGVASPVVPRLAGVRRFMWSKMQNRIRVTRPYIAALVEAGVTPMLTKGAARIALDPSEAAERYSHDIDLVAPPEDWERTVDLLLALGLQSTPDWPRERLVHGMRGVRHSQALKSGEADIDLHQSALRLNRAIHDDDAMRARALPATFAGVPVLAASASDRLMMAFCHGLLFDSARPGDWALDAAAAMRSPDLDWGVFEDEVRARALSAFATCGLAYMREVIGLSPPAAMCERLAIDASPVFMEELGSAFRSHAHKNRRESTARCFAQIERARRSLARMPETAVRAPVSTDWVQAGLSARNTFVMALPPGADPRRDLKLEVATPPLAPSKGLNCRVLAFPSQGTVLAEWEEPGERTVALRMPGALLSLHAAREVRLEIAGDQEVGSPPRYRWSEA